METDGHVLGMRAGDRRELALWLSAVDGPEGAASVSAKQWEELWEGAKKSSVPVLGFGGPPGAGKSTLLRSIVQHLAPKKVIVLCIDPTSPLSGGALLGDRVRLHSGEEDDRVFIRSLASHGAVGAISPALDDMILIARNTPADIVIVEGVGSGQAEYLLKDYVDFFSVLVVPESGDGVQLLKAGTLEIADAIILNKADRPQAEILWQQLQDHFEGCILARTNGLTGDGTEALTKKILSEVKGRTGKDRVLTKKALARRLQSQLIPKLSRALAAELKGSTANPYRLRLTDEEARKTAKFVLKSVGVDA
jgi:LAO/AO transport system kinase